MQSHTNREVAGLVGLIILLLVVVVLVGVIGFKFLFKMSLTDAFYNATITASTLGTDVHERTSGEKIFTGIYGIISCVLIISLISAIISYIFIIFKRGGKE